MGAGDGELRHRRPAGAVFLEILPHAVEHAGNFQTMGGVVLAGILAFFILEKLVLWRHCPRSIARPTALLPMGMTMAAPA